MRALLALTLAAFAGQVPVTPASSPALTVQARALQPGEVVVVTVTTRDDATAVGVTGFGVTTAAFRTDDHTWQALLGIDLDQRPGTVAVTATVTRGSTVEHGAVSLAVAPRRFPTRRLRVNPSFVSPTAEQQRRIAADAAFLESAWAGAGDRLWVDRFVRPVPGPANSRFGSRSVFNGQPRAPHGGTDFLSAAGTPVRAPNAGRVVCARDLYFTGNTVVIDHGLRVFSLLAHLARLDVREGDLVENGQVVGLVGATGRVTGPHLHWTLRIAGARVDPLSLLAVLGPEVPTDPPASDGDGRAPGLR